MSDDRRNLLDQYLDGQLPPDQGAEFLQRLSSEEDLQAESQLQARIDEALQRIGASQPDVEQILAQAQREAGRVQRPSFWRRSSPTVKLLLAALILGAIALALRGVPNEPPLPPDEPQLAFNPGPQRSFYKVYQERSAAGFQPDWACESDKEFRDTFGYRLHQGLNLAEAGPGTEVLGLAYVNTISEVTIALLARVDGAEVIVFVDRSERDSERVQALSPDSGLQLHRSEIGELVLYELTPLSEARATQLLRPDR